jgi:hypothetical protein
MQAGSRARGAPRTSFALRCPSSAATAYAYARAAALPRAAIYDTMRRAAASAHARGGAHASSFVIIIIESDTCSIY